MFFSFHTFFTRASAAAGTANAMVAVEASYSGLLQRRDGRVIGMEREEWSDWRGEREIYSNGEGGVIRMERGEGSVIGMEREE
jgi:hypothetical protein